jgi:hypothetical protein
VRPREQRQCAAGQYHLALGGAQNALPALDRARKRSGGHGHRHGHGRCTREHGAEERGHEILGLTKDERDTVARSDAVRPQEGGVSLCALDHIGKRRSMRRQLFIHERRPTIMSVRKPEQHVTDRLGIVSSAGYIGYFYRMGS